MLSDLSSADFMPHLHTTFRIHVPGEDHLWPCELIAVDEHTQDRIDGNGNPTGRKAFSLLFLSPRQDAFLSQAIYTIEHDALGTMDLFLVPLGPDGQGIRYESVFA